MSNLGFIKFNTKDITTVIQEETVDKLSYNQQSLTPEQKTQAQTNIGGPFATETALSEGLAGKQPVGDYATNTTLTQALEQKLGKTEKAESAKVADSVDGSNVSGAVAEATHALAADTATKDGTGNVIADTYMQTQVANATFATLADTYNKSEVDQKVSSVYKYKGSVPQQSNLPQSDQTVGDVYNVEDTDMNYAWDGTKWDPIGGIADLSSYLTKSDAASLYLGKTDKAESAKVADSANSVSGSNVSGAVALATRATNADAATKLASARTIGITGDATWSVSFNGSNDVTAAITLAPSGASAGAYGPAETATLTYGGSFNVPCVTVDTKGRVTKAEQIVLTMPAAPTSVSGNSGTATKLQTARTIGISGAVTGTATSFDGSKNITIASTAVDGTKVSVFGAASADAAGKIGAVPAPAAGSQSKYLRADGTWQTPPNTTYRNMVGASSSAAGKAGLVPAPSSGHNKRFLRGDGTWQVPSDVYVKQRLNSTSQENPLLASGTTAATGDKTVDSLYCADVTLNPSTGTITANSFKGPLAGNASTATKLATARSIRINLASTRAVNFDGSGNITPGVTGTLGTANGGTGRTDGKALNVTQVVTLSAVGPLGYTSTNAQYLTTSAAIAYWNGRYSSTKSNLQYCKTGTIIGSNGGTISGNLTVNGTLSGGVLSSTSDRKLKNVIEAVDQIDLSSLVPYRYSFKNDNTNDVHIGLIAQDVQNVVPEAVKPIDEQGHLGIEYNAIVAILVDKINKLERRVEHFEQLYTTK